MGFNNTVTVVGNVPRDPELRFTPGGAPVASFGLAWNRKDQNGEEVVSFFDITCWRSLAENVAESRWHPADQLLPARLVAAQAGSEQESSEGEVPD